MPSPQPRHAIRVLAVLGALVACLSGSSSALAKGVEKSPRVLTCEWIAKNPAKAVDAMVTCDSAAFFAASTTAVPALSALTRSTRMMSQGCVFVPSSGYAGQGVFAWTSYQYSTSWLWSDQTTPVNYTWYIQTSGGSNYNNGGVSSAGGHGPVGVPANIYRWGAQNHSSTAAQWYTCWNDN